MPPHAQAARRRRGAWVVVASQLPRACRASLTTTHSARAAAASSRPVSVRLVSAPLLLLAPEHAPRAPVDWLNVAPGVLRAVGAALPRQPRVNPAEMVSHECPRASLDLAEGGEALHAARAAARADRLPAYAPHRLLAGLPTQKHLRKGRGTRGSGWAGPPGDVTSVGGVSRRGALLRGTLRRCAPPRGPCRGAAGAASGPCTSPAPPPTHPEKETET